MSTSRPKLPVVAIAAITAGAASAAEVDFRPILTFGVYHDGNIAVTGEEGSGDEVATLGLELILDRRTPQSLFTFSYHPSYVAYNKSEGLDYFSNTLALSYSRNWTTQTRLTVGADAGRTDRQGLRVTGADRPVTFLPRTTQDFGHGSLGGTFAAGRRALIDWGIGAGVSRSEDVPDNPATPAVDDPVDYNDSVDFSARGAWRREISERTTLGLGLDASYFDFEATDSVFVESLGLVGSYNTARTMTLAYALGATRANSADDSDTAMYVDVTLTKMPTETSTFGAGLRQTYTPGSGIGGASQDRGGWVSYDHTSPVRGVNATLLGGYWERLVVEFPSATPPPPGTPIAGDTKTFTVSGTVGWSFNRHVALNAAYAYVDQRAKDQSGAPPEFADSLDTRYGSYGINLRWNITGRGATPWTPGTR